MSSGRAGFVAWPIELSTPTVYWTMEVSIRSMLMDRSLLPQLVIPHTTNSALSWVTTQYQSLIRPKGPCHCWNWPKTTGGSYVEMFEILPTDWNLKPIFTQKWASRIWTRGGWGVHPGNSNPVLAAVQFVKNLYQYIANNSLLIIIMCLGIGVWIR